MTKRQAFPQLFKYFPSSSYGKYDFIYGERRKLNYWFIYNVFPVYGRYWFYYEIIDDIYIVNNEILTIPTSSTNFKIEEGDKLEKYNYKDSQLSILGSEFYNSNYSKKDIKKTIEEYALWANRRAGMRGFVPSSSNLLQRFIMEVNSLSDYLILREVEKKIEIGEFIDLLERFGTKKIDKMMTKQMEKTVSTGVALCKDMEIAKYLEGLIADIIVEDEIITLELSRKFRRINSSQSGNLELKEVVKEGTVLNSKSALYRDLNENMVRLEENMGFKSLARKIEVNRAEKKQVDKVSRHILKDQDRDTVVDSIDRKLNVAYEEPFFVVKESKLSSVEERESSAIEKKEKVASIEKLEIYFNHKNSKKIAVQKSTEDFLQKKSKDTFGQNNEVLFGYKIPKKVSIALNEKWMSTKGEKSIRIEDKKEKNLETDFTRKLFKENDKFLQKKQTSSLKKDTSKELHKIPSKNMKTTVSSKEIEKGVGDKNIVRKYGVDRLTKANKDTVNIEFETLLNKLKGTKEISVEKDVPLNKADFTEERKINKEKEDLLSRIAKVDTNIEPEEARLQLSDSFHRKRTETEKDFLAIKTSSKVIGKNRKELKLSRTASKTVEQSKKVEKRLELHKRLWFIKQYDTVDYKILPKNDYEYPPDIGTMLDLPKGQYQYSYFSRYKNLESVYNNHKPYIIEVYDKNYSLLESFSLTNLDEGNYKQGSIEVEIVVEELNGKSGYMATYKIIISKHKEVSYLIIRQPKDSFGNYVIYSTTEKFIENKHPLPIGRDMGIREVPIHVPIMVEFVNILMLFWAKYYLAFTGYTGTMAIFGMVNMVHDWLNLASSSEFAGEAIEDYQRCFRWFRWEAEKVYNKAKHDPDLSGNLWVEEIIFEMIDYIETHHMNIMPQFKQVHIMDEYRNLFADPSFDIEFIVDKVKGVRKRVLDKNKRLND